MPLGKHARMRKVQGAGNSHQSSYGRSNFELRNHLDAPPVRVVPSAVPPTGRDVEYRKVNRRKVD